MHRIYEEQCELFIEQEIEEFVKNGIDEEMFFQYLQFVEFFKKPAHFSSLVFYILYADRI